MRTNTGEGVAALMATMMMMMVTPWAANAQARSVGDVAAQVEAREIAFAAAMADRDLEAFLSFVSEEAIFFGAEVLRGRAEVGRGWAPFFEGDDAPFSWHPDQVEPLASGTLALSTGPVRSASGEVVGRFNSVWRLESDGAWRVVFDKGS